MVRNILVRSTTFSPVPHQTVHNCALFLKQSPIPPAKRRKGCSFSYHIPQAVAMSHTFTSETSHNAFQRLTASALYFSYGPLNCTLW